VAINGAGFFQVLMPDGTTAYTRDGSFQTDNQGQVVTSSGYPVQPALTLPAGTLNVTIGNDGTVSAMVAGTPPTTQVLSPIQLATFINPAGLQSQGQNLYVETASSGTPSTTQPGTNGSGLLSQGYVETSNVNVVEEMVNMIQTQRAYEINSKAITTSDQMLQKLTQM
jgi:flagellar basal-body rod protein FlgG